MPSSPFTIRIFVPDGDPEGVRIIDRMNWTGMAIVFPRDQWGRVKQRQEFKRPGVYILVGYEEEDDLPTIYVGQGDGILSRIESHAQSKDFWTWAIGFVSNSAQGGLNRAHITWLEYALLQRVNDIGRSHLDNGNLPREPALTEAEKADTQAFLEEILQILPLAGLRAFEHPKAVTVSTTESTDQPSQASEAEQQDTIVVPAKSAGFQKVFLGENAWYAIRIAGGMISKIKWIAAYQTQPVSAITHIALVKQIEPYGEAGKYKVIFSEPAKAIDPIPYSDATSGSMQGPRYSSYEKILKAKKLSELWPTTA